MVEPKRTAILGPHILARTMSTATARGKGASKWQYHSRSDTHSKVACWTLLFDLMAQCDVLRDAARLDKVGFGINHVMVGPINKTLDLVITWNPKEPAPQARTFGDLVRPYGIVLADDERAVLERLPRLCETSADDVAEVAVALEAKACMTEHVKSLPRLHAEILATGYLAKLAVKDCIAVSYSLVNAAPWFDTPSDGGKRNNHVQPSDARRVVEMLSKAIPTRASTPEYGYDAIGITVIDCRNDGSPVTVIEASTIGPNRNEHTHYERMVRSLCSQFRARFARF